MIKNKILYVLLAFLIIANGFFLYDYLGKPDRNGPRNNPQQFIVKELNFNQASVPVCKDNLKKRKR